MEKLAYWERHNYENSRLKVFFPTQNGRPYAAATGSKFRLPRVYIDLFEQICADREPVRFIASQLRLNMMVSIESFSYSYIAQNEDVAYEIYLKEYRRPRATVLHFQKESDGETMENTVEEQPENPDKHPYVGCSVRVNGRLYQDSYGNNPGRMLSNYQGKISLIVQGRSHPYHITTPEGDWLGWVTQKSVQVL